MQVNLVCDCLVLAHFGSGQAEDYFLLKCISSTAPCPRAQGIADLLLLFIVCTGMQSPHAPCIPPKPRAAASQRNADTHIVRGSMYFVNWKSVSLQFSRIQELTYWVCAACHHLDVELAGAVVLHPAAVCTCLPLPALLVRVWPLATKTHTVHALLQH